MWGGRARYFRNLVRAYKFSTNLVHTNTYVCMYVCMDVCMYKNLGEASNCFNESRTSTYVCMYVCICVCVCV